MDIYEEILSALKQEDHFMLATIISTSGSTPAAALSKMLVKREGIVSIGTVGGGCMEGEVLLHANRLYDSGRTEVCTFTLNEEDVEHGLICGGSLDVLIEPITREDLPLITAVKVLREEGEDCVLARVLKNDGSVKHKFIIRINDLENWNNGMMENVASINPLFQHSIPEILRRTYRHQQTALIPFDGGELILEPTAGTPKLIIFGGGHVSKYVSRSASMAGFNVTIVDDREKYANKLRFPEATRLIAADFPDAFNQLTIKPSTYIVIVTRGHQYDEEVLRLALGTPANYIGMIGSKRKVFTTFEHLAERGVSLESLRRVHAPIGIDIGALTAEEIGISIVAQLIYARRGEKQPLRDKSTEMSELFHLLEQKPHFV
jgi:xanthine dehydrogenase accessory factor